MLLNQAWMDEFRKRARLAMSEEWEAAARRIEAHLGLIEREVDGLREVLAGIGLPMRRQRIRITTINGKAAQAHAYLQHMAPHAVTPKGLAAQLSITSTYAYDLLSALVAEGSAEKLSRGQYRARAVDLSGD